MFLNVIITSMTLFNYEFVLLLSTVPFDPTDTEADKFKKAKRTRIAIGSFIFKTNSLAWNAR